MTSCQHCDKRFNLQEIFIKYFLKSWKLSMWHMVIIYAYNLFLLFSYSHFQFRLGGIIDSTQFAQLSGNNSVSGCISITCHHRSDSTQAHVIGVILVRLCSLCCISAPMPPKSSRRKSHHLWGDQIWRFSFIVNTNGTPDESLQLLTWKSLCHLRWLSIAF